MLSTLEEFIEEIHFDWQENEDSVKYLFFLGAGCSKSSGIDLASELANKWYEKLESSKPSAFKNFKKSNVKCNNENKSEYYFEIFTALFPDALAQQKEVQRLFKGKLPAVGYYILAELMKIRAFNTVITTNFDDLIQDALIYSNKERALVLDEGILKTFYTHVSDKEKHMIAEMLEGLEKIASCKFYDIAVWEGKYSGITYKGWSFNELEAWIATKDKTMQQKLHKALSIYKTQFKS